MSDAAVSLLILGAVVVLFVWNRFPVELVAVGAALAVRGRGGEPWQGRPGWQPDPATC